MNEEMMKSLVSLIDESLAEIEELKKSDRFSASEVKVGDSEGLAGKDKNGSLGKEDAEKADDDDKDDDDKDDKDDDDKAEKADDDKDGVNVDKSEGKNSEADPNAGKHQVVKEEGAEKSDDDDDDKDKDKDKDDDDDDDDKPKWMDKSEGKNSESAPNAGHHKLAKSFTESLESQETLMKSYIDDKVGGLEGKLEAIAKAVQDLADSPVPSKGATYKSVQPLAKSADAEVETLNKSQIVEKLFDLKKSGEQVETVDIASAELGNPSELVKIVNKYNIK